jgi:S1-C subfamily serine protease
MEEGYKPCPYCAEPIRIEAIYCKHCSRKLAQPTSPWRWVILGIVGVALLCLLFYNLGRSPEAERQSQKAAAEMARMRVPGVPDNKQGIAQSQLEPAAPLTMSPQQIFDAYSGSVVLIQNYTDDNQLAATGSGFCIGDSVVATNYHVIRGASRLVAKGKNSTSFESSDVESYDPQSDLAVVRFENFHLKAIPLGDPTAVKQGDHVTAIGSPLGIQNTLSDGIVSNLVTAGGINVIQTSAPISHGSSGGPLFNDQGQVIGITAATRPEGELVNFAISAVYLKTLLGSSSPVQLSQFLAQTRTETPVLQGSVSVPHGRVVPIAFKVPANHVAVIQGTFTIYGGAGNDINWALIQGLPNGQGTQVIPLARYSGNSAINRRLPAGDYALVFDNRFSAFSSKTVTGTVSLIDFR